MTISADVTSWLLESDPALRWQVERDLAGAPAETWQATKARVANEGFGAQLLSHQDPDGQWAGGAYFPAGFDFDGPEAGPEAGQPYTATTWSLNSLREWGVASTVLGDTAEKLAENCHWEYNNLPYWGGEVDCCINSWTLSNGVWLGVEMSALAQWFIDHQLADGGWNCEWVNESTRSSFHSTLNSLKGLLSYEIAAAGAETTVSLDAVRAARQRGEDYLLQRRLLHRLSTGEIVGDWATKFVYPFRWFYSALHAVDYFRAAALVGGTGPDPRLAEAIELIRSARQPDGTWLQERRHPGRVWFEVDVPAGEPSKWLTFYGTRALLWWDTAQS